jgi:hypothetical protein
VRALGLVALATISACSPAASQPVASSAAAVQADEREPMAVMARADKLAAAGQTKQALREYLWALDHGVDVHPAFTGVRDTFLIQRIIKLGSAEPSALRELEARAARLEDAILTSKLPRRSRYPDVGLYVSLNYERNEQERTMRVYRQLRQRGSALADDLYDQGVFERLLEQGRYADILEREDWCNEQLDLTERMFGIAIASFRSRAVDLFEALAGAKRNEEAIGLLARVEARDVSAQSFVAFMERAARAGNTKLAVLVLQRGREHAPPGEQPLLTQAARELRLE